MRTLLAALFCALAACGPAARSTSSPSGSIDRPDVRVACLGASSTAGYGIERPYPGALDTLMGAGWQVENLGVSGNKSADLLVRWREQVRGRGYTWLILQGGFNDLGAGVAPSQTMTNLRSIAQEARDEGVQVVIMTLWPFKGSFLGGTTTESGRRELNGYIRAYCQDGGVICMDIAIPFTSPDDPEAMNPAYASADKLHPSQAGADFMAQTAMHILQP